MVVINVEDTNPVHAHTQTAVPIHLTRQWTQFFRQNLNPVGSQKKEEAMWSRTAHKLTMSIYQSHWRQQWRYEYPARHLC